MNHHHCKGHAPAISRRGFLKGAGALAGAAATSFAFAPGARAGTGNRTLVYLFLRGGMDGLSLVPPVSGADLTWYANSRDATFIDPVNPNPALRPHNLNGLFGLHPNAGELKSLYDLGRLAIVQAAGHPPGTHTRSHFDAQEQIELGTPGEQSSISGWLARHLQQMQSLGLLAPGAIFTAMASSSNPPASVTGWPDVATLDSTNSFHPNSGTFGDTHLAVLGTLYGGNGGLDQAARAAVDAVELISSLDLGNYIPGGGIVYPNTGLASDLKLIAQLMKQDIGIAVATVDYGGWDTHNGQGVLAGTFNNRVGELSEALYAFYQDLALSLPARGSDVTIVVQSEFGRQIDENANSGTDHGLGNPMLVLGGDVIGGMYGTFPGLAPAQQTSNSVTPTTDFRRVMATVLDRLIGNGNIAQVFPGFSYTPMAFAP